MLYNVKRSENRKKRVRLKLKKSSSLRLSVFKSNRHFYVQLIDDSQGKTLASASTLDSSIRSVVNRQVNSSSIKVVAKLMAERLKKLDSCYQKFVFDKGPYKYMGVVSVFADELRGFGFRF